jgi:hypothetical protein
LDRDFELLSILEMMRNGDLPAQAPTGLGQSGNGEK